MLKFAFFVSLLVVLPTWSASVRAEEIVSLEGGNAILNAPTSVAASVILVPGGDRDVSIDKTGPRKMLRGVIVFTRKDYVSLGVASLLIDKGVSIPAAVEYMRKFGKPIILVGLSNGSLAMLDGLGSRPAGIVLWSARLNDVKNRLGDASALPRALVLHNHDDHCEVTKADYVEPFLAWAGNRAQMMWVGGGYQTFTGNKERCENPAAPHFMGGREGQVVSAIASFAKSFK